MEFSVLMENFETERTLWSLKKKERQKTECMRWNIKSQWMTVICYFSAAVGFPQLIFCLSSNEDKTEPGNVFYFYLFLLVADDLKYFFVGFIKFDINEDNLKLLIWFYYYLQDMEMF